MVNFENDIRRAFERRLAANPASPDLRVRVRDAAATRGAHSSAWRVAGATAALLMVGVVTFYLLHTRQSRPAPVIGPTPTVATPTPATSPTATPPASPSPSPSIPVIAGGTTQTTDDGVWTAFTTPTQNSDPTEITKGPDGAIWFTENSSGQIGRVDAQGRVEEFPLPDPNSSASYITSGPDGALWFTEFPKNVGNSGRISTDGHRTEYQTPTALSLPLGITVGPDGALWFTEQFGNNIGRITTSGQIREFPLPNRGDVQCGKVCPRGIVTGPDGALWFTESQFSLGGGNRIGRMTTGGQLAEYTVPTANSAPWDLAVGADGNIWFSEGQVGHVGRITMSGKISEFTLHTANLGAVATGMVLGPFGNMWFPVGKAAGGVAATGNQLGRIAPDGTIVGYAIPGSSQIHGGIASSGDGALWFTYGRNQIWRFVPRR
jgi:virginiamycin B lyase